MLYIQKMHNKVPCTLLLFVVLRTHLPKYLTIKYTSTFYVLSHRSHAHFATFNLPTIHLYGIWVHKIFNYYQPQCAWGIWYSGPEVQNTHFCGWWIFSKTIPWVNFSAMYQTKHEKTYMFSTSCSQFFCDVSTRKSNPSLVVFCLPKNSSLSTLGSIPLVTFVSQKVGSTFRFPNPEVEALLGLSVPRWRLLKLHTPRHRPWVQRFRPSSSSAKPDFLKVFPSRIFWKRTQKKKALKVVFP